MSISFDEYQHKAMGTAAVRQKGRAGKAWAGLEFSSEALELAALITSYITKSQFRPKGKAEEEFKVKLKDELGDALWTITAIAYMFDFPLGELAESNLAKVGTKHVDLKKETADPAKPKDPFPWVKGNKKNIKTCPTCGSPTKFEEGCVSCTAPDCGWSAC
jgi:NTP pyrophosphatase (non-canonical NTP hydrolase)